MNQQSMPAIVGVSSIPAYGEKPKLDIKPVRGKILQSAYHPAEDGNVRPGQWISGEGRIFWMPRTSAP